MRISSFYLTILLASFLFSILPANASDAAREGGRRITASDLATITDIEGLSVSPDGRWIAFQTRRANPETNTYALAWYVLPAGGGEARRIAEGGEPTLSTRPSPRTIHGGIFVPPPVWSPDSRWITYLRQDGGNRQLWRSSVDGRRTEQLTNAEGDITGFTLLGPGGRIASGFRYSEDGRRLFFQRAFSQGQLDEALAVEGRSGFHFDERFVPSYGPHPRAPLGTGLVMTATQRVDGRSAAGLRVYDFTARGERLANDAEIAEFAALDRPPPSTPGQNVRGNVVVSPGGGLAWAEARDPQQQGMRPPRTIVARPAGATAPITCEALECTGQFVSPWLWRNNGELLFQAFANADLAERVLYAWRPQTDASPRVVYRTHGLFEDLTWDCAPAQERLICFLEELNYPRRLIAINLDTGAVETLYDPNPGWSDFDLGPPPRVIDVRLPSGARLPSYLVLPPDYQPGQRVPLVVATYVCDGFLRGGTGDEYPIFPLAAQGFAVLCHNHLSDNYEFQARANAPEVQGEQFSPGDPFQRRIQQGLDVAITEMDRLGVIDTSRIGLTGLSQGAGTVRYALFNMAHLTAAIASTASSESSAFIMGSPSARRIFRQEYGIDSQFSPRFNSLSLARNASNVRAPLLVNVSDQELLGSMETIAALEDAGRALDVFVYPGEYHVKWQPVHRLSVYNRNIDWMNFWLRGVESGLTGNMQQYQRWRAMRENQCRLFGPEGTHRSIRPLGGERLSDEALTPWYCRPGAIAAPTAN